MSVSKLVKELVLGQKNINDSTQISIIPISPLTVYHVTTNISATVKKKIYCLDSKCDVHTNLRLYSLESCTYNFVCNELAGNSCGDYGIR